MPSSRQNAEVPGGNVTGASSSSSLRTMGRIKTPRDSTTWSSPRQRHAASACRDVGYAEDGTKEQRSVARLNGVPAVTLEVRRQSGANTVEVIEGVKKHWRVSQASFPRA